MSDFQSTENALLRVAYFDEETAMYLAGLLMKVSDSNEFDAVTYIQAESAALAIIAAKIGGTFEAARKRERNEILAELKARFAPRPKRPEGISNAA